MIELHQMMPSFCSRSFREKPQQSVSSLCFHHEEATCNVCQFYVHPFQVV